MLRVLLLSDEMEVGGTQRQIVHLAKGLDRLRFSPAVAYFRNSSFLVDELSQSGIEVRCIPKAARVDPGFFLRLRRFVGSGFDVVHCFSFSGELWGTLAALGNGGAAVVSSIRGTYEWYGASHWAAKRWVASRSAAVVANSRVGAEYAAPRLHLAPEAIRVVPNGVEFGPEAAPGACEATRAQLGIPEDAVLGLFVGRFVNHKNLPALLTAIADVRQDCPSLVFLLVGGGELLPMVDAARRELGLVPSVHFLGPRDDVRSLMQASDFLALTSVREGLPNVILEAMAEGLPVIASLVGANGDVVADGETGILYRSRDHDALVAGMRRLVRDADLRRRMGRAGRERVRERFSVASMVRTMEGIYEASALGRRQA